MKNYEQITVTPESGRTQISIHAHSDGTFSIRCGSSWSLPRLSPEDFHAIRLAMEKINPGGGSE